MERLISSPGGEDTPIKSTHIHIIPEARVGCIEELGQASVTSTVSVHLELVLTSGSASMFCAGPCAVAGMSAMTRSKSGESCALKR